MRVTFLGHQGWHIEHEGRALLLDPILEKIGNGAARMPIWPARRLDFARLGSIDAAIVSHEHADHFSLETLHALPRRCQVLIPDLASSAMAGAIAELGFSVARYGALRSLRVGTVRVTPLPGLYNTLEPDAYALLFEDATGASFLTGIDTVPHPDLFAWLAQHCPHRTLDNLTNNFIEPRAALVADPHAFRKSRAIVAQSMLDFARNFAPARAVVSGQGWSFEEPRGNLNRTCFSVDNRWLTETARILTPHVEWHEGVPGMCFELRAGTCKVTQSDALGAVTRTPRDFDPHAVRSAEAFAPWTQVRELSAERYAAVHAFIRQRFGQIIGGYAPKLMERLYYLKCQVTNEHAPVFALRVRNGDSHHLFELDYGQLSFSERRHGPGPAPVCGVEMWAADLELLIAAGEEAFTVYESAVRPWSDAPEAVDPSSLIECFMWFTPRFRPDAYLDAYRKEIARMQRTGNLTGHLTASA